MDEKCFACGRKLGKTPKLVDTRDSQLVYVGVECFKEIQRAGEVGYQPPKGGPRLYLMTICGGCDVRKPWEHRCHGGGCQCMSCKTPSIR
jgi:hypothetical protein